ncbi:MAG: GYF domain-containing protein [Limisphaerales bacterium]
MYKIIGADQKEYGPVTAEQLRQWVTEGRVNAQTSVWSEAAGGWKPLASHAEFADLLASKPSVANEPPHYGAQPGLPPDLFTRDYDLDIGRCIGDAWELMKKSSGLVIGGVAIFFLIQLGLGGLAAIPFVGPVFSLANLIITGPLMGGVYYFLLRNIRGQSSQVGDVFAGFRLAFGQLLLCYLVMALLILLSALPGLLIMAVPVYSMVRHQAVEAGLLALALLGLVIAMVPLIYFSISWIFALPLVIDKQMDFWPALSASRRMVAKHWWLVFGLAVVCGLIKMVGFLACCVGLFFTLPIGFGAMMNAYESIFSAPASRAA